MGRGHATPPLFLSLCKAPGPQSPGLIVHLWGGMLSHPLGSKVDAQSHLGHPQILQSLGATGEGPVPPWPCRLPCLHSSLVQQEPALLSPGGSRFLSLLQPGREQFRISLPATVRAGKDMCAPTLQEHFCSSRQVGSYKSSLPVLSQSGKQYPGAGLPRTQLSRPWGMRPQGP